MARVIFSTIHGSHLYGLENTQSDLDIFTVTDSKSKKAKHFVREDDFWGQIDEVEVGLKTFMQRVQEGSHQSVEALFSDRKVWGNEQGYRDMLEGMKVAGPEVFSKYERTIKKFCFGDYKRRRHACRLSMNLWDMRDSGRFNPRLQQYEALLCGEYAERFEGEELFKRLV